MKKLIMLGIVILMVGVVSATITFDNEKGFNHIYKYVDGVFNTTNFASSSSFDLFSNSTIAGDMVYFGIQSPSFPFHDLKFNISTNVSATNFTVVWEYLKQTNSWTAIPNLTDNTDNFQNIGENWVLFDVPEYMCATNNNYFYYINIGGVNKIAVWVRARVINATGITEGATTSGIIKLKDWTITATDEANLTMDDIYDADVAGAWGQVEKITDNMFFVKPHLYLINSDLTSKKELIQIGRDNYPSSLYTSGLGSSVTLGEEDASGKGKNGVMLIAHTRGSSGYTGVHNLQAFASIIDRKQGSYGAMLINGVFKFVDSVFNSNQVWYLSGGISAGSEWTRSVYAVPNTLLLYSPNLAIDRMKFLDSFAGFQCGFYSAVITNTDIAGKNIVTYYGADIDLIDSINIDKARIIISVPDGETDINVRIHYKLNLKIVETNGSSIYNATVILTDEADNEVFNVNTYSNGSIDEQTIMVYDKWWEYLAAWTLHEDDYNPFTLKISVQDYSTNEITFTLEEPTDWTIALEPRDWNYSKSLAWKILNLTDTTIFKLTDEGNLAIAGNLYENTNTPPSNIIYKVANVFWLTQTGDLYLVKELMEMIT